MSHRPLSMLQAINEALHQAMEHDDSIVTYGEDISGGAGLAPPHEGVMGGTFGATKGLLESFGPERVRDTPISEAAMVGIAVGAAAAGIRPVVDMMWSSFTPLAFDQIVNQAAKLRYMFGGQTAVPMVLRMAMGAGLGAAGQHSDTLYSIFTHIPGLKVVTPSSPADAKGLLLSAIADDDPVLFFEHMRLYNVKEHVPQERYRIPLGEARVLLTGADLTIVGIAQMVRVALEAAKELATEGIESTVIDPRTLSPLDLETITNAADRTGRLVIVDESPPRCGIAADIAASVSERVFGRLQAPIARVTAPHTPVPLSPPLEQAYIPDTARVVAAARRVVAFG